MTCRLVTFIYSNDINIGAGKDGDPLRELTQLYTMDGELVAQCDQWNKESHWTGDVQ